MANQWKQRPIRFPGSVLRSSHLEEEKPRDSVKKKQKNYRRWNFSRAPEHVYQPIGLLHVGCLQNIDVETDETTTVVSGGRKINTRCSCKTAPCANLLKFMHKFLLKKIKSSLFKYKKKIKNKSKIKSLKFPNYSLQFNSSLPQGEGVRDHQRRRMSQPQEEDKKPNDQSAHINLKVKGQVWSLYPNVLFIFSLFRGSIAAVYRLFFFLV